MATDATLLCGCWRRAPAPVAQSAINALNLLIHRPHHAVCDGHVGQGGASTEKKLCRAFLTPTTPIPRCPSHIAVAPHLLLTPQRSRTPSNSPVVQLAVGTKWTSLRYATSSNCRAVSSWWFQVKKAQQLAHGRLGVVGHRPPFYPIRKACYCHFVNAHPAACVMRFLIVTRWMDLSVNPPHHIAVCRLLHQV